MSFESYTDCLLNAFVKHNKQSEVTKRKQEIINGVSEFYNFTADSVLYVGFNPAIITDTTKNITVTQISKQGCEFLIKQNIKFEYVEMSALTNSNQQFDVVIALDEYFTFAETDSEQQQLVSELSVLAKEYLITTCKDYKNQDFKDREFSNPAVIRGSDINVYLEFHNHSINDKNNWHTEVYNISKNTLTTFGPYRRRAMFFKQLAKFSSNAGAVNFCVHKNLMYKSLIKKNYEHVISIQFDHYGSQ
jgi:hypothetical protein